MTNKIYGISDLHINNGDYKFRLDTYKKLGFDFVSFTWFEHFNENNNPFKLCEYAKEIGLKIDDIHLDYETCNDFWSPLENNNYIKYLEKSFEEVSKIGVKNVIVHISRSYTPPEMNEYGISNLKYLLTVAKKYNIVIHLENLKKVDYLEYLLDNVKDESTVVCLDVGHANIYMRDIYKFIEKYKEIIKTTHLHDNFADYDSHLAISKGNINFVKVFKKLEITNNFKIHLEVYAGSEVLTNKNFYEFVEYNFKEIKKLYLLSRE